MIIITALFSIFVFLFSCHVLRILPVGNSVFNVINASLEVVFDKNIDDDVKEKELQKQSLRLFGIFGSLVVRIGLALLFSFAPVWGMSQLGYVVIDDVVSFLFRWDVIVTGSVIVIAGLYLLRKSYTSVNSAQINYSPVDRMLHCIAFSDAKLQLTAVDIEHKLFRKYYQNISLNPPIFITSLPRAGTTLMLEMLHCFEGLATNTYRDMPFLLSPVLWDRLSGPFRISTAQAERAHGDGMRIGHDSPEAFDEVIWRKFWSEKYGERNIGLWSPQDTKKDAVSFFNDYMKKISFLRRPGGVSGVRYISKNNANIARIDLIKDMFPESEILVMIRNPFEQARSLLRQHKNFTKIHAEEPFVCRYMAHIGHYEFGQLHRPIAFPGIEKLLGGRDRESLDYWLAYWIAAFAYVLERKDKVRLVDYEAMCLDGTGVLTDLCSRLAIFDKQAISQAAGMIKVSSPIKADESGFCPDLSARAKEIHASLMG